MKFVNQAKVFNIMMMIIKISDDKLFLLRFCNLIKGE